MTLQLLRTMKIYDKNKKAVEITDNPLASGGEGSVYMFPGKKDQVIKVYHDKKSLSVEKFFKQLSKLNSKFITPKEVFFDSSLSSVVGFSMKFVNFSKYHLLNNLFSKPFCAKNNIDSQFKIDILAQIKEAVQDCHKNDIVIGDLNQYNIFFSLKKEVVFVDVDSYSNKNNVKTDVLLEDIRDYTSNTIDEKSDAYSFDVLSFWALTNVHPYKWVLPGNTDNLEQRVRAGKSILSGITGIKIPPVYVPLQANMVDEFKAIFNDKRRFFASLSGGASTTTNVVIPANIVSTQVTVQEIKVTQISDFYTCGNRIAVKTRMGWFIMDGAGKGMVIMRGAVDCDKLFISTNNYCYIKDDKLHSSDGKIVLDVTGLSYHYYQGELFLLDFDRDSFYVLRINNQLSGVDYFKGVIFAPSVVVNNAIIQNFGAKKYLGLPVNRNLQLTEIPYNVLDAYVSDGFANMEILDKGKITSNFYRLSNGKAELSFRMGDNLLGFCAKGNVLFLPQDHEIHAYQNGTLIDKIEIKGCSSQSKLQICDAGILMLENSTLYLLNKK